MLARVRLERRAEPEASAGYHGGEQRGRAREAAALAEERRDARRAVAGEDGDPHRVVRPEGDVRERQRQLPRHRELPVTRRRGHGGARVEQEVDDELALGGEAAHEERVEAGDGGSVEGAEGVAGGLGALRLELDARGLRAPGKTAGRRAGGPAPA